MNEQEREAREFKHIRENDPGFVAPRRPARRQRVVIRRILTNHRIDDIQPRVITLPNVHPLAAAPAVAAEQADRLAGQGAAQILVQRLKLALFELLSAHGGAA